MDSYVVKVQNKGTIRRLTLAPGEKQFSYEKLQDRIRDLLQLSVSDQFVLTYTDKDGDVVTMAEDEDLKDALVLQKLNPLRVSVANSRSGSDGVKASLPVVQSELKSDTEQQQLQQESIQGEQIPQTLSQSLPVDPVANTESVTNSGEKSTLAPEEEVSTRIEGATDSNPSDASSPASETAGVAGKETFPEGAAATTTENKSPESEEAKKEDWGRQIHSGIKCDGCGMIPIAGPRFKSCKKPNYDLCLKCFEASGAEENEYAKIDRLFYRIGYPAFVGRLSRRPYQTTCRRPDQRQDSTPDSSGVKNSTAGTTPAEAGEKSAAGENSAQVLHQGVQCDECGMVPIEGPRFKSSTRFNYDLCQSCFEKSGGNASEYSRFDEPFIVRHRHPLVMGQILRQMPPCFGQNPGRWAWVLNRMVPILAIDQTGAGETIPAAGSGQAGEAEEKTPAAAGSDVKVGDDAVKPPQPESTATEGISCATSAPKVDVDSAQEGTTEEPAVDAKAESNVVEIPVTVNTKEAESGTSSAPETQTPGDDVENNVSSTENDTVNNAGGKTAEVEEGGSVEAPAVAADGDLSTKEGLLAKLAAMGFEDPKLNGELLEKNNFDLRKTLDDLCAAEEWDPILGELQEMGFYDANMNRRLMFKNNGSVKRVVKELVQMYKGEKSA